MLNAAAAAAAARNQQPFGLSSPPGSSAGSSAFSPATTQQQIQMLQKQVHQDSAIGVAAPHASSSGGNATIGALLKMNSSGGVVSGVSLDTSGVNKTTKTGIKNGQMYAVSSGTVHSGSPSPPGLSTNQAHDFQDQGGKFGSPSPRHSPNPLHPQASSAQSTKRPEPIQLGSGGAGRLIDDNVGGVAAPTTPASPYTGQQGMTYYMYSSEYNGMSIYICLSVCPSVSLFMSLFTCKQLPSFTPMTK